VPSKPLVRRKNYPNEKSVDDGSFTILRGEDNHYIIPKSRLLVDFRLNDLLLVELASLSYIE